MGGTLGTVRRTVAAALFATLVATSPAYAHGDDTHTYVSKVVRAVNATGIRAEAGAEGHLRVTAPRTKVVVVNSDGAPSVKFERGTVYTRANGAWVGLHPGLTHEWHDDALAGRTTPERIVKWMIAGTVDGRPFAILGTLEATSADGGVGYEWLSYLAIGGFVCYLAYVTVGRRVVGR